LADAKTRQKSEPGFVPHIDTTISKDVDAERRKEDMDKYLLSLEEFYKHENQSEEKVLTVREPAREFARKIFP
jgi:hypothetical protein